MKGPTKVTLQPVKPEPCTGVICKLISVTFWWRGLKAGIPRDAPENFANCDKLKKTSLVES